MPSFPISQTFNRQEVTTEITVGGQKKTTVGTMLETAQEITLTQDPSRLSSDYCLNVSKTQDLAVFGDVVRIEGNLTLPGKDLIIVARTLILENDSAGNPPSIVVDGVPLEGKALKLEALQKGATPENYAWTKIRVGAAGANAIHDPWKNQCVSGQEGQSAKRFPHEMNGEDGKNGTPGNAAGGVKILCQSIKNQLPRLLEHLILGLKGKARTDGRLTEPSIRLATVGFVEELEKRGNNFLIVAFAGPALHIRIFDADGGKVADKAEGELVRGERLTALKESFDISLREMLQAAGWATADQLAQLPVQDQRQLLIDQLNRITRLPKALFRTLSDRDLAGRAAVIAFLIQTGIRHEAGLQVDVDYRQILLEEVVRNGGYDRARLQGCDDAELVRLALERTPENKFTIRGGLVALQNRLCGTISLAEALWAGTWVSPSQLFNMSEQNKRDVMVQQLSRITGLPKSILEKRSDGDLAANGAAIAFLLKWGARKEDELNIDGKSYRKLLIGEIQRTIADAPDLSTLDDQQLVRLALEPRPGSRFNSALSLSEVLEANRWRPDYLAAISVPQHRQVLIAHLNRTTGLPDAEFEKLTDYELAGRGAATAFLLATNVRDAAGLKANPNVRRTLIDFLVSHQTDHDQQYLATLDDQQLVRLATRTVRAGNPSLDRTARLLNHFFGLERSEISMADVLETGTWLKPDRIATMSAKDLRQALIGELSRITGFPGEVLDKVNDRELIGRGAVIALLLRTGIADEASLHIDRQLESFRKAYHAEFARHVSVTDVLLAGNWRTHTQLDKTSDPAQRQALVDELSRISRLPNDGLKELNDGDLVGRGLATAFLLQMGLRDEAGLGVPTDNDRNTVIVEVAGKCGFEFLQGLDNQQLVRLALEEADDNWELGEKLSALRERLRNRWVNLTEERQEKVIADVASVLGVAVPAPFAVSARGGAGGEGQPGQEGADGGTGGNGLATSTKLPASFPGSGGEGGRGGKGGDGGPGGTGGRVLVHVIREGRKPSIELRGGDPGNPGAGGLGGEGGEGGRGGSYYEITGGNPGPGGLSHTPQKKTFVTVSDVGRARRGNNGLDGAKVSPGQNGTSEVNSGEVWPESLLKHVHVSQLVMMWQKVRAEYVAIDPATDVAAVEDLTIRLKWVESLLKAIPSSSTDFFLAKAVLPGLLTVKLNTSAGLNYFGFGPYDVPSVSLSLYRDYLDEALSSLEKLEKEYKAYFQALREERDALASFDNVRQTASNQKNALDKYQLDLRKKIKKELEDVDRLDRQRLNERKTLQPQLEDFVKGVSGQFPFSPEKFFNCLSQLSFVQEGHAVGGAMMVASQAGDFLHTTLTSVATDTGDLVNTSYLLKNIRAFNSPDLKTDFATNADGFADDRQSYQTIASYDKMKKFFSEFVDSVPAAREVTRSIQDHIETIADRNRHLDRYNALLRELSEIAGEQRRLEIEIQIASDQLTRKTPGIAAMANFVYGLYETVKTDCLEALHLLYRAQCFWLLQPLSEFHDIIGYSPEAITYNQLNKAKQDLKFHLVSDLNKRPKIPSPSKGILVVLTPQTHPEVFSRLKNLLEASFHLAPATKHSDAPATILTPTLAAFTGDTLPDEHVPNPFFGQANMRLTKVRAWMVGMVTTNKIHLVNIEHSGREVLWRDDNIPYPRRASPNGIDDLPLKRQDVPVVVHAPIEKSFIYGSTGLKLDLAAEVFERGDLKASGAKDSDLGYAKDAMLGLPGQSGFAAIGPFTTWHIKVPKTNAGLDLSNLSAIVMEFDGFSVGFD